MQIFIHGALPPPVNGLAVITKCVTELLMQENHAVVSLNVATPAEGVFRHIIRLVRSLAGLTMIGLAILRRQVFRSYFAMSSGWGAVLDAPAALLSALFGSGSPIVHHHNYSYLVRPSVKSRLFIWAVGKEALHVCLCAHMQEALRLAYPRAMQSVVLSNAFIVGQPAFVPVTTASKKVRVGYFSAVTVEKGAVAFARLAYSLADDGVEFVMGGGGGADVIAEVRAECGESKLVTCGPLYGAAKNSFLQSLDVLVFPSTYQHEAEPLVIYEALAAGVTVVAYPIGCVPSLQGSTAVHISTPGDIEEFLRRLIRSYILWPDLRRMSRKVARDEAMRFALDAKKSLQHVVSLITS